VNSESVPESCHQRFFNGAAHLARALIATHTADARGKSRNKDPSDDALVASNRDRIVMSYYS
jgi:hypothetical protein